MMIENSLIIHVNCKFVIKSFIKHQHAEFETEMFPVYEMKTLCKAI
jgi:hypothetical protein